MRQLCLLVWFAGVSLPAQHVDESWQSAEFFANKVAVASMPRQMVQLGLVPCTDYVNVLIAVLHKQL